MSSLSSSQYQVTVDKKEFFAKVFAEHPPKEGQEERYALIRHKFKELGIEIVKNVPKGREQDQAMFRLQESMHWCFAAIGDGERERRD